MHDANYRSNAGSFTAENAENAERRSDNHS